MAAISDKIDFVLSVIQPKLTKGLRTEARERLNLSGDFKFTEPKQITVTSPLFAAQEPPQLTPSEITEGTLGRLNDAFDQLNIFCKIVDKRCKHITVNYDPNKKGDEAITDACSKVFSLADGTITYDMYVRSVQFLGKLERYMGHRSAQNEGFLDGS
jgi:hypothetical protein